MPNPAPDDDGTMERFDPPNPSVPPADVSYALPPGELIAVAVIVDGQLSVSYYEDFPDETAAQLAAEIIAHQMNGKSEDEIMPAAMEFQSSLVAALTAAAQPPPAETKAAADAETETP